ncbi:CRISPR-associated protein Csm2 [Thermosipho sp. 1063]|nr:MULTISPECIES: type III-A CRISPR-associated protein Csm2 [Thermosipho]ANQ54514.1 CRISPR-associated protein Csm2 [Thermosipho sp. 1070]APT72956.1 CRISPR-associated protein Csm2 [Thermosipho sp. 1063]
MHDKKTKDTSSLVKGILERISSLDSLAYYKMEDLISDAEKFGEHLSKNFKANQIRKFHSYISKFWQKFISNKMKYENDQEKFKEDILDELSFVKVYLAYQAGRTKSDVYKDFEKIIGKAIDKVKTSKDFETFKKFYDAILAYHKYYGGKD